MQVEVLQGVTTQQAGTSNQPKRIRSGSAPSPAQRGVGEGDSPSRQGNGLIDFFDVERADALVRHAGSYGCAAHGSAECLCDVVVESPTPITDVPPCLYNFNGRLDFIRMTELMLGKLEFGGAIEFLHSFPRHLRGDALARTLLDNEEILTLLWDVHWDSDYSQRDVASLCDVTVTAIAETCDRLGWEWVAKKSGPRPVTYTPQRIRFLELYSSGVKLTPAIRQVNEEFPDETPVTYGQARAWRHRHGTLTVAA